MQRPAKESLRVCLIRWALVGVVGCTGTGDLSPEDTSGADTDLSDTGETDVPCTWGDAKPGESVSLSLEYDGVTRTYQVHLPTNFDCTPRPLILGLHGYYGSGKGFEQETSQMFDRIDALGMVGIFPDGLAMGPSGWKSNVTSFNDIDSHNSEGPDGPTCTATAYNYGVFDNCPPEESDDACNWGTACSDDEGLLRVLIEQAVSTWSVDAKRVYLTGFSQGGQTTQSLAWRLSDVLAAAAPQHGFATNGYTQAPSTPMGLFQVWATNDRTVDGNDTASSDGMMYDGAAETATIWAAAQGCETSSSPYPTVYDGNTGWGCIAHEQCSSGAEVVSCSWEGRHTWGRRQGTNFALEAMLEFLGRHARP